MTVHCDLCVILVLFYELLASLVICDVLLSTQYNLMNNFMGLDLCNHHTGMFGQKTFYETYKLIGFFWGSDSVSNGDFCRRQMSGQGITSTEVQLSVETILL